jgi:hypothetical protein
MKKILFLALFATVVKLAPFGLVGTLGVPGVSALEHTPLGLVGVAFADVPPPPVQATPATAKPASEMAPTDVQKWLTFFDKLVSTVVDTQRACDKMAVDVSSVMDTHKDAIAVAKKAKAEGRKLPADAKQKMVDGVKKMMPGMQNCGQNDKVRAAFAKLDLNH